MPPGQYSAPPPSKFRVKQLPVLRRRRRTISPDSPHHNETRRVSFTQAALVIGGVLLFIVAMVYFFALASPFASRPPLKVPESHTAPAGK